MNELRLRKVGIGLIFFNVRIQRNQTHIPIGVEQRVITDILQPDSDTLVFRFADGSEEIKKGRTRKKYIQEFKRIKRILDKVNLS